MILGTAACLGDGNSGIAINRFTYPELPSVSTRSPGNSGCPRLECHTRSRGHREMSGYCLEKVNDGSC